MPVRPILLFPLAFAFSVPAAAQDGEPPHEHGHHEHDGAHTHRHGLHFVHPLFAESVSPDTKARLDYAYADPGAVSELEAEGEYAFGRAFSVEAGVHFDPEAGALGDTHVIFKGASYALDERRVLLGYGVAFGLPTGGDGDDAAEGEHEHPEGGEHEEAHGHGVFEAAPFVTAGVQRGRLQVSGWTFFVLPTDAEEAGAALRASASALYGLTAHVEPVVEVLGEVGLSGAVSGREVVSVAPGLRVTPVAGSPFTLGAGVNVPLTSDREADVAVLVSAFYHL